MKPEKTCRFLDYLLQPLGLKTIWRFSSFIALVYNMDTTFQSRYSITEDTAFYNLFNGDEKIQLFDPNGASMAINNPYFGCRSLDEAAIRRDLLSF